MIKEICVDCSVTISNPGKAEYRGMDLETGKILFDYKFPTFVSNNIAEWVAIVHAINYCKSNNLNDVKIYSDSKIAIKWVRIKKHKSKINKKYPKLFTPQLEKLMNYVNDFLKNNDYNSQIIWWNKRTQGREIPADYGRK
jgi:ribonuclease HI